VALLILKRPSSRAETHSGSAALIERTLKGAAITLDSRSAERLRKGALALRLASNPFRLRIILRLSEGQRTVEELARDLGFSVLQASSNLDPLRRGGLVKSDGKRRQDNRYDLTEVGFKTVRYIVQTFGAIHWKEPLPKPPKANRVGRKETDILPPEEIDLPRRPNDKGLTTPASDRCNGTL
jgi:DNA-binding transcriptional ArsR family regulator